jgi:hypothetical protein
MENNLFRFVQLEDLINVSLQNYQVKLLYGVSGDDGTVQGLFRSRSGAEKYHDGYPSWYVTEQKALVGCGQICILESRAYFKGRFVNFETRTYRGLVRLDP